jgi:flagellar biosynthetic protein FliR
MNPPVNEILASLAVYLPVFVRISAAVLLMPAIGEAVIPATVRIGLSAGIAIAVSSAMPPRDLLTDTTGIRMVTAIASELLTGIWFGWLTRLVALALPMAGQYAGYLIGLSNVLQADVEPAAESGALASLFSLIVPLLLLTSGLYTLPLRALVGLFDLVPVGHVIPWASNVKACVAQVETLFRLSLQFASPFVIISIFWNLVIGQMARLGGRMQIYFLSFPGQILLGLFVLMLAAEPMLLAWEHYAGSALQYLPGYGK